MKFCQECGHKCVASGGKVPKFCPECGFNLSGDVATASTNQPAEIVEEDLDFNIRPEDAFVIESSHEEKLTFGTVASQEKQSGSKRARGSVDLKDFRTQMKTNKPLEA